MLRQIVPMAAIAAATGRLFAALAGRSLESILSGSRSHSPFVLSTAAAALRAAALRPAIAPARRAVQVTPIQALRHD